MKEPTTEQIREKVAKAPLLESYIVLDQTAFFDGHIEFPTFEQGEIGNEELIGRLLKRGWIPPEEAKDYVKLAKDQTLPTNDRGDTELNRVVWDEILWQCAHPEAEKRLNCGSIKRRNAILQADRLLKGRVPIRLPENEWKTGPQTGARPDRAVAVDLYRDKVIQSLKAQGFEVKE